MRIFYITCEFFLKVWNNILTPHKKYYHMNQSLFIEYNFFKRYINYLLLK